MQLFWAQLILLLLSCLGVWGAVRLDVAGRNRPVLLHRSISTVAILWGSLMLLQLIGPLWLARHPPPTTRWLMPALAVLGFLLALPWPRRWLMPKLGLSPQRLVHTLVLYAGFCFLSALLILQSIHIIIPTGLEKPEAMTGSMLAALSLNPLHYILLALLGVGWLNHRKGSAVLQRLHLTRPPLGKTAKRIGLGLSANVGLASCLHGLLFTLLFLWIGHPPEHFFALPLQQGAVPPTSLGLLFVLLISVGAGVSEEILFRGALQPRLGVVWTSLLFMSVHVQYPPLGLLSVFLLSLVLGIAAKRYGLWVAIGIHALNNLIVSLLPNLMAAFPAGEQQHLALMIAGICNTGLVLLGIGVCCAMVYHYCCKQPVALPSMRRNRYLLLGLWSLCVVGGITGLVLSSLLAPTS